MPRVTRNRKLRRSVKASRAASLKGWRTRKALRAARAEHDQAWHKLIFRLNETTQRKPTAEALANPWLEFTGN